MRLLQLHLLALTASLRPSAAAALERVALLFCATYAYPLQPGKARFTEGTERTCRSLSCISVLVLIFALSRVAHAVPIVINNGLAPPNPSNVINDATHSGDEVHVRNVGCPPGWPSGNPDDPCPAPSDSTEVEVAVGANVFWLEAYDSSTITMSGGTVHSSLEANGFSTVTISGGAVEGLETHESGNIWWTGGTVVGAIAAGNISTITIEGSNFAVDGVPVGYGNLAALTGNLTGTLASGDGLNNVFYQGGYDFGGGQIVSGTITLVPEPSTALLLATGLLGLAARRR